MTVSTVKGFGSNVGLMMRNACGETMNRFVNENFARTASTPAGYDVHAAVPAITAGGMSALNPVVAPSMTGALLAGGPMEGSGAITITQAGGLSLVVSLSGNTGVVSVTGDGMVLKLTIGLSGEGTWSLTGAPNLAMIVPFDGTGTVAQMSGTSDLRGHLSLEGEWTPFTALSPEGLAQAVWQRVIEAGFTAEEIIRILAAQAAGAATGLEGSNPQFTGLDGTTVRIDGTYSAGTRTIDALDGA